MKKRLNIFLLAFPLCPVFQIQAQEKPGKQERIFTYEDGKQVWW